MFKFRFACVGLIALASNCISYAAAVGPISQLYLTKDEVIYRPDTNTFVESPTVAVVQGGNITNSWAKQNATEWGISVIDDVRTIVCGCNPTDQGAQYTLGGLFTGVNYLNPNLGGDMYDSTTDGNFNYLVSGSDGTVYQTDRDYSNPVLLFITYLDNAGITYDETNNSLWISNFFSGTTITNYSLSGTPLSNFSTGHDANGALALDHADQTLWLVDNVTGDLEQYAKNGTFLGTGINVYNLSANTVFADVRGGEFAFIPEPATYALLGSGLIAVMAARRNRRCQHRS
jgi:hypothetical protein